MHPDTQRLAAYLDDALAERERKAVRTHVLTCGSCASRLRQLRTDADNITAMFETLPAPDVRSAVRARHRRRGIDRRWAMALVVVIALAVVAVYPLLTAGQRGSVLAVADNRHGQLLALDATNGATLASVPVGERPTLVRYDGRRGLLYVLTAEGVAAVRSRTWNVVAHWHAAAPTIPGATGGLAVNEVAGLLYVARPEAGIIVVLDAETLQEQNRITRIPHPGPLALLPDGRTLAAIDGETGTLWTVALPGGQPQPWTLGSDSAGRRGWLAVAPDGQSIYVARGIGSSGTPPDLWRANLRTGQLDGPARIGAAPPPQDLALLNDTTLAVARGDGQQGGVELFNVDDLHTVGQIDPATDAHILVPDSHAGVFVLNWSHNTIIHYDGSGVRLWNRDLGDTQPRGGALVEDTP